MLNLRRIFKNYEEVGSLNAMVNLFGFLGPHVFLTKSGDIGVVLEMHGVDYECLEASAVDMLTKRLESALRLFDENYRLYQFLFKRNRQAIPHSFCGKPVVDAAIRDRMAYFEEKAGSLFSLSTYIVVLCPALSAGPSLAGTLLEFPNNPGRCWRELAARFFTNSRPPGHEGDGKGGNLAAAEGRKLTNAGQGLCLGAAARKAGSVSDAEAHAEFRPAETRSGGAQARYLSRLLLVRIAP